MSFKEDFLFHATLQQYADLSDLEEFQEEDQVKIIYEKIVDILNDSGLLQTDVIKMTKNLTLNTINQCQEACLDQLESEQIQSMQRELK